jgi:hypothetical protein
MFGLLLLFNEPITILHQFFGTANIKSCEILLWQIILWRFKHGCTLPIQDTNTFAFFDYVFAPKLVVFR